MLTYEDKPTVTNAILKRLDSEPGVKIAEIKMLEKLDCIAVGVQMLVDDRLDVRAFFDLPPSFHIQHLHNEIDEVAEQVKEARRNTMLTGIYRIHHEREMCRGTGLRGRWLQ